jgi:hypothetical protein
MWHRFTFSLLVIVLTGASTSAQDSGLPDTVYFGIDGQAHGYAGGVVNVPIYFSTDAEINAVSVGMEFGLNGWLMFDSCSEHSTIFEEDGYLDISGLVCDARSADGNMPDSVLSGGIALAKPLPAGRYRSANIWFTGANIGDQIAVDSCFVMPAGPFILTPARGDDYSPQFVGGTLDIVAGPADTTVVPEDTTTPPGDPGQPVDGDWVAPTGFGQFTMTVADGGTEIDYIFFEFDGFNCGWVTLGGSLEVGSYWPIVDNQFTIDTDIDPYGDQTMTIEGTFTSSGDEASGTWVADIHGTICSGDWGPVGPETSGIREIGGDVPTECYLMGQNYPNPFNASTNIRFSLPQAEHSTIAVYNVLGMKVATLVDQLLPAGEYETSRDASGVASGVYFYRMKAGDFVETKKLMLMK